MLLTADLKDDFRTGKAEIPLLQADLKDLMGASANQLEADFNSAKSALQSGIAARNHARCSKQPTR